MKINLLFSDTQKKGDNFLLPGDAAAYTYAAGTGEITNDETVVMTKKLTHLIYYFLKYKKAKNTQGATK